MTVHIQQTKLAAAAQLMGCLQRCQTLCTGKQILQQLLLCNSRLHASLILLLSCPAQLAGLPPGLRQLGVHRLADPADS